MVQKLADHIVFIGFMGSGKSSVSRRLARFESMNCIDMDIYIEREANMKIPEIFAREGEAGFRQRERDFLRGMLVRPRCILSCGGGVVTNDGSRELLKQLGTVVYLKVDAEEAVARISRPETRPLLSGSVPPAELLASRLKYYEDAADITVNTGGRSVYQVVKVTQKLLRKAGKLEALDAQDAVGGDSVTGVQGNAGGGSAAGLQIRERNNAAPDAQPPRKQEHRAESEHGHK